MTKRPIYHAEFGRYLVALRESNKLMTGQPWTQSDAARFAAERGLPLTRLILRGLEEGKTKNPEADVLRAVADLYEVPYTDLVTRLVSSQFNLPLSDLSRHGLAIQPLREVPQNAQAELRQLRAEYNSLLRDVRDLNSALFRVLHHHPEKPAALSSRRRQRTGTEANSRPRGEPPG